MPAPRRLAPHSVAFAAEVSRDGDEIATGRFVVLHDPAGQDGWRGDTRVVAFVSAEVDPEMAGDPALAEVGWSWLQDSLNERQAAHTAAGGTVTRTASLTFGLVENPTETNEVEVRASWSPLHEADGSLDLGVHLLAWCDLLCATAGVPPVGCHQPAPAVGTRPQAPAWSLARRCVARAVAVKSGASLPLRRLLDRREHLGRRADRRTGPRHPQRQRGAHPRPAVDVEAAARQPGPLAKQAQPDVPPAIGLHQVLVEARALVDDASQDRRPRRRAATPWPRRRRRA